MAFLASLPAEHVIALAGLIALHIAAAVWAAGNIIANAEAR